MFSGLKQVDGIVYDYDAIIERERLKSDNTTTSASSTTTDLNNTAEEKTLYSVSLENLEFLERLQAGDSLFCFPPTRNHIVVRPNNPVIFVQRVGTFLLSQFLLKWFNLLFCPISP